MSDEFNVFFSNRFEIYSNNETMDYFSVLLAASDCFLTVHRNMVGVKILNIPSESKGDNSFGGQEQHCL